MTSSSASTGKGSLSGSFGSPRGRCRQALVGRSVSQSDAGRRPGGGAAVPRQAPRRMSHLAQRLVAVVLLTLSACSAAEPTPSGAGVAGARGVASGGRGGTGGGTGGIGAQSGGAGGGGTAGTGPDASSPADAAGTGGRGDATPTPEAGAPDPGRWRDVTSPPRSARAPASAPTAARYRRLSTMPPPRRPSSPGWARAATPWSRSTTTPPGCGAPTRSPATRRSPTATTTRR